MPEPAPSPGADALPEVLQPVLDAIADESTFVMARCSGSRSGTEPPAVTVTVRPVDLSSGRHLQFSSFDGRRTDVENLRGDEARARFADLLVAGFRTVLVRSTVVDLQVVFSRKGVPRVVRHAPTVTEVDTSHDRAKTRLLDPSAPFLRTVGITDHQGRIKPTARAKYTQVERFLEILGHTLDQDPMRTPAPGSEVHAVDLGCGAGVLTMATYHYLTTVRGLRVTMTGVDTKADLMARLDRDARELGWTPGTDGDAHGLRFVTATIAEATVDPAPALVLALHACDTATDDALARAVRWGATWILAAPCCQHDLQAQLDRSAAPGALAPLLRHGIVRERLGDLLTDTLRAELLRAEGYRTDVIEFVSTEHTAKNLMIRAVRTDRPDRGAAEAAAALAAEWSVTPALATRLHPDPPRN
jgi:hypothetical protein